MVQGKVTLREISRKLEMEFNQKDEWVVKALEKSAPHQDISGKTPSEWAAGSVCTGDVRIERLDPEYTIEGHFQARVPVLCPRCTEEGTVAREGNFRIFVRPQGAREVNEEGDDPDYIFLSTPWLDMIEILSEQLVAAESLVERPDQDLAGKPHECETSKELEKVPSEQSELSTGQNDSKARNSPFAVLGKLKELKGLKRGK
ncbi:MAG: YceD family protein [bacterium]